MKKLLLILSIECMFAFVAYAQPSGSRPNRPDPATMSRQNWNNMNKHQFDISKEVDRHDGKENIMDRRVAQNSVRQERRDQSRREAYAKYPRPLNENLGNPIQRDIQRDKIDKWEEVPFQNMMGPCFAGPRTHNMEGKHSPYLKDYRYYTPRAKAHNFEERQVKAIPPKGPKGRPFFQAPNDKDMSKGMEGIAPRPPKMEGMETPKDRPYGPMGMGPRGPMNFTRPNAPNKEALKNVPKEDGKRAETFIRPEGQGKPGAGFGRMRQQRGPMNFDRSEENKEAGKPEK